MEAVIGAIMVVIGITLVFLLCMVPSWLLLLVYDYVAQQVGWTLINITFMNVLAVTVLIWLFNILFNNKK